jgi:hypothetical protein
MLMEKGSGSPHKVRVVELKKFTAIAIALVVGTWLIFAALAGTLIPIAMRMYNDTLASRPLVTTASRTRIIIQVFETDTFGGCTNCTDPGSLQVFVGSLALASDPSTIVGRAYGQCSTVAVYPYISPDLPIVLFDYDQHCLQGYAFDGTGNIAAGTIEAAGRFFVAGNGTDFGQTNWAITGGTLAYAEAQGQLFTTTQTAEAGYFTDLHVDILN